MNAIILSTGDELVLGQTVDTNSAYLSRELASVGLAVRAHLTVGDSQDDIATALEESVGRADFILITGGIGPTEDDRTRHALADLLRQPLEPNPQWLERLQSFFTRLGRTMPETNKIQAMLPRGVKMLDNTCGTACGMDATYQSPDQKTICRIFVMPGVPKEMKEMFRLSVRPQLETAGRGGVILSRTLHTFGLGESTVAEKLGDLMNRTRNPSVGTTVSNGIVSLRINARFPNRDEAQTQLDATDQACRAALGDIIFGADDETLPQVVARLLTHRQSAIGNPQSKPYTVTTAESCTGGLLAKYLTDTPGSSDYFKQGWVVYANDTKRERLGVPTEVLNLYGAVSEPVVQHLARNARRLAKSTFALAISGVAGPTGGSPAKPVGTVCIALAYAPATAQGPGQHMDSDYLTRTFTFTGDREMIRDRSAKMALTLLRFHLLGKPLPF
jgi:nicotinamide-nucleotide amidase